MFYRWRRMEEEDRGRVWRLYGWFAALMACGSCVGAVAWVAQMMSAVNVFTAQKSPNLKQADWLCNSLSTHFPIHGARVVCCSGARCDGG